jgi:hypothetical protein
VESDGAKESRKSEVFVREGWGSGNGKHADFTKQTAKTPPRAKTVKKSNCFGLEIFSGF